MSRCLIMFILLLEIYFIPSASVLEETTLTTKASSVHTAGSNITNFASTVKGTVLTGYYSYIQYTDAECSVVRYAENYPLNVCFPWVDGYSMKIYANGTHLAVNRFSDYSCANLVSVRIALDAPRVCDSFYETVSIAADYSTVASSTALLSAT